MKVYFVVSVGRQVEGDMHINKFEKCYKDLAKAENYIKNMSISYADTVSTPEGPIQFVCQRGIYEIELEE